VTDGEASPFTLPNSSAIPPASTLALSPAASARALTQRPPCGEAVTISVEPSGRVTVSAALCASPKSSQGRKLQVKQNHSSLSGSFGAAGSRNAVRRLRMKRAGES
jgi:hypothetical protein